MDSEAAIAVLRNMTPVLGVVAQDVKSGVMIKVVPSNMADAGLKKGDVITGIDGIVIRNRKELRDIVRSHVVGDMLTVDVSRGSGGPSISLPWVIQAAGSSPELINALRQRKVGSSN
jgi:S1-C subfamily serine protease